MNHPKTLRCVIGAPLPYGVAYTWGRVSRRQAELKVYDGHKVIFHALTDGRMWSKDDVCELLRRGNS